MVQRYDIILLGATGLTGKSVVKELALISKEPDYLDLGWGIAGRSKNRLNSVLTELECAGVNMPQIPVFECDIFDEDALKQTCRSAKVLMNCTGPSFKLSEPVVKACIETRTHYIDVSLELPHILKMYRTYYSAAKEANVLVITSCGFASIPADMGLMHLEKYFEGTLQTVECYMEVEIPKMAYFPCRNNCLSHFRTWESISQFKTKNFFEVLVSKRELYSDRILGQEPQEIRKCFIHRKEGKIWYSYPGPDSDIVYMTQKYLHEEKRKQPIHFKIYTSVPLLMHLYLIFLAPVFFCYYWLYYLRCFKYLFKKHPKFFTLGYISHEGPSEEMINDTKYSFVLTGTGWDKKDRDESKQPTKKLTLKISGSDPRHKATASCFVMSAITILKDSSVMPSSGVFTTGVAFRDTKLVERVNTRDVKFKFL